ncbi:MAG TPA: hypothetical protein VF337_03480, partial [Candidatus Limnocylindrales bacterium]
QRSADMSVDHAQVLSHYRAAHEIALRDARGEANTEDLRQAVISSRMLFDELVERSEAVQKVERSEDLPQETEPAEAIAEPSVEAAADPAAEPEVAVSVA